MLQKPIRLLLIEDEEFDIQRVKNTIQPFADRIILKSSVSDGVTALERIQQDHYDVVIMDYRISGGLYGENLVEKIKAIDSTIQIIVITKMTVNQSDIDFANRLIAAGAYWFGTKYPVDIEEYIYQPTDFVLTIMNAYDKRQLEISKRKSEEKLDRKIEDIMAAKPLIGDSPAMTNLKSLITKYAKPNANVLIMGESGTGKELVASNIHYESQRKYENYVTMNCAAVPKDLIESELFGYEEGAFTGAQKGKKGLFEQADGGTILLDEIGELPMDLQAKLLRVLQDGEIDKIGRKQKHTVDVRVIASTNRDINQLLKEKKFREDLFYRLNILQIKIQPLRNRKEDLPALIAYFQEIFSKDLGVLPKEITASAMKKMGHYDWPGNVRQLRNVVQRMVIIADDIIDDGVVIQALALENQFVPPAYSSENILPITEMEKRFKAKYFQFVRENSETDAEAAEKLGLAPSNYHRTCKNLGLK